MVTTITRKTLIDGCEYFKVDKISGTTIADSFSNNKIGTGHGEAKLYVGTINQNTDFWDDDMKCCFFRNDLIKYMDSARLEYKNPRQAYLKDIGSKWKEIDQNIRSKSEGILRFNARRSDVQPPRYYITSDDPVWNIFRRMALPNITFLTIFKLKNADTSELIYCFKIFLNSEYDNNLGIQRRRLEEEKIASDCTLNDLEKQQLLEAGIGQGKFRHSLVNENSRCLVTSVSEPSLLFPTHIKPWNVSNNEERLDKYNGLILSPTFSRLLSQGLITFEKGNQMGIMRVSDHMNNETKINLNVEDGYEIKIPNMELRLPYLEYHKKHVFMG